MGYVLLNLVMVILVDLATAYPEIAASPKYDHPGPENVLHQRKRSAIFPVCLKTFHITSLITVRYVETNVLASFTNLGTDQQDVTFRFTLPPKSFISNFVIMDGYRHYQGEVMGEKAAMTIFNDAKRDGNSAFKAQASENSLQFQVDVIVAANSTVNFSLTYEEFLRRDNGMYHYNISIAPEQVVENFKVQVIITEPQRLNFVNAHWMSEPPRFLPVDIDPTNLLGMRQARVLFRPSAGQQRLVGGEKGLSGNLSIQYEVMRSSGEAEMQVFHDYFTHFFSFDDGEEVPKQVVLVIDTSRSMRGSKLANTKSAVNSILRQFNLSDQFNILAYSNTVQTWSREPRQPTRSNLKSAVNFVERLFASGAANIKDALVRAASQFNGSSKPSNVIFFITDSAPNAGETQPDAIISEVTGAIGGRATLFCVSLGEDADTVLLKSLSRSNEGIHRNIKEDQNVSREIVKFFNQVTMSVLSNIKMKFRPSAAVPSNTLTKTKFTGLSRGKEIVVAGKVDKNFLGRSMTVVVNAKSAVGGFQRPKRHDMLDMPGGTNVVDNVTERIWVYLRVEELLDKEALAGTVERERIQVELQILSLKYQLVTPPTCLLFKTIDSRQAMYCPSKKRLRREPALLYANSLCKEGCFAVGDPHFIINTPNTSIPVCFDIRLNDGAIINLLSDPFQDILVNGEMLPFYFNGSNTNSSGAMVKHNLFSRLGLRLNHHKIDISQHNISVDSEVVHSWREKTAISLNQYNITIHGRNTVTVTRGNDVAMRILRHTWIDHPAHFDFYLDDGEGFSSNVHGIIGQFKGKLIEIVNGSFHTATGHRQAIMTIGNKEEHVFLKTDFTSHGYSCWWAKEDVFVGDLSDYIVPGLFDFISD